MKHIFSSNCVYSYKHVFRVLKTYDSHLKCVEILFQMFIFIITIATACRLVTLSRHVFVKQTSHATFAFYEKQHAFV